MKLNGSTHVTWRTHLSLALLALVYIFSVIDRKVIAPLIEPIKREFDASDTQMGLLRGLAFGLLYATLGVPVGKLADRHNRRLIVAVCCSLWSVATLACELSSATSHMVGTSEHSVVAALLNFFITLFGVGAGPLVTGMVSDLLTPVFGVQALRWSLVSVMLLMFPAGWLLAMAASPYRARLRRLFPAALTA